MAEGRSNVGIAEHLNLSEKTVETYVPQIRATEALDDVPPPGLERRAQPTRRPR